MPTSYRITYRVLPAGTGPDDYEPDELQQRTDTITASDPEPAGEIAGEQRYYLPPHAEFAAALREHLAPGDEPLIIEAEIA